LAYQKQATRARLLIACLAALGWLFEVGFARSATPLVELQTDLPLLNAGDTFRVNLRVTDATPLFGASAKLTYDSSRLEYIAAEVGELFLTAARFPPLISVLEAGGTLALTTSRNVGDSEVFRDGVLVSIRFRAARAGIATMGLDAGSITLVTKSGVLVEGSERVQTKGLSVSVGAGMVLNPSSGPPRTVATVSAAGFLPNEDVQITLDGVDIGAPARSDASGQVLFAPVEIPDAPASARPIVLLGVESKRRYETRFQIVPTLDEATAAFVGPGDVLRVSGEGFGASERVTFQIQGVAVTTILGGDQATAQGKLSTQIGLPNDLIVGPAELVVEGRTSRLKAYRPNLTVQPRITTVTPPMGPAGTNVLIAASGFAPGQQADCLVNGQVAGTQTVGTRGTVSFTVPITTTLVPRSERAAIPIMVRAPGLVAASAPFVYVPNATITAVTPEGGDSVVLPGETVRVTGTGFLADAAVTATFGAVAVPPVTAKANSFGEIDVRLSIPAQPSGPQTLTVRTGTAAASDKSLTVAGRITDWAMEGGSSPKIGALGTILVVHGAGFVANETISFDLGSLSNVQTTRSDASGSFRAAIVLRQLPVDLPAGVGEVVVRARDKSNTAQTTVLLSSPSSNVLATASIRSIPATAAEGDTIHIVGLGFGHNHIVGRILLDTKLDARLSPQVLPVVEVVAGTRSGDLILADPNGAFDVVVAVPPLLADGRAGEKEVLAEFPKATSGAPAIAAPLNLAASVRVTDAAGNRVTTVGSGDSVFIQATGFQPFETPQVQLGSSGTSFLGSANQHGQIVNLPYFVQPTSGGDQTLQVRGLASGTIAETVLKIVPKLTLLSPPPGSIVTTGLSVTVRGAGFPDGPVAFDIDGIALTPSPSNVTSVGGTFIASFTVFSGSLPVTGAIRATVGSTRASSESLRFSTPGLAITPASGRAGTTVKVRGALGNTVTFGSQSLGLLLNSQSVAGVWEGEFVVPSVPGGSYVVVVGTLPVGYTAPTFAVTPTVSISPTTATPGERVAIAGDGFGGDRTTTIAIGSSRTPTVLRSRSDGSFSLSVVVPAGPGGITRVVASDNVSAASVQLRVRPVLRAVEPDPKAVVDGKLPAGANLVLIGDGFEMNEELTATVGGTPVVPRTRLAADANGSLNATVPMPAIPTGLHDVAVRGSSSGETVSLTAAVGALAVIDVPKPSSGAQGTVVLVTGSGFGAREIVRVKIGSSLLGESESDASGTFRVNETFAGIEPNAALDVTAVGLASDLTVVREKAFTFRDSRPPTILSVEEDSKGKTLITGDVLAITVVQSADPEKITEATYSIGTVTGALTESKTNADGTRVWTATVTIPEGASVAARAVDVTLTDLGGNKGRRSTTTRVTIDAVITITVGSVTGSPATSGETIAVTATGERGGTATFSIAGVATNVPMTESSAGTYKGSYTAKEADRVTDGALSVAFVDASGNRKTLVADTKVTIIRATAYALNLAKGLNLISLPVDDPGLKKASDLIARLGTRAAFVLSYDTTRKQTVSYVRGAPTTSASNAAIRAGAAYLVMMEGAATLDIKGTPWREEAVPLVRGVNFVGLVADSGYERVSDIALALGDSISAVVHMDTTNSRFVTFTPLSDPTSPDNRRMRPGDGVLIIATTATALPAKKR